VLEGASARRARRATGRSLVLLLVSGCTVLLGSSVLAEISVQGTNATLRWSPAAGPVSGYIVSVSRNGGTMHDEVMVTSNQVTIAGKPGDLVQIAVRAWGYPDGQGPDYGPSSESSEPIRFTGVSSVSAVLAMECQACGTFAIVDTGGSFSVSTVYPTGGSWELVGTEQFVPGRLQALLHERNTGALWIGDVGPNSVTPYASQSDPSFSRFEVARPYDLDGDGAAEIVMHDEASGLVEIWGMVNGALVRRTQWAGPIGWHLFAVSDLDGDAGDLWFDAHNGLVAVARFQNLAFAGSYILAAPSSDATPVDVSDYDGDGMADVLWRDDSGVMTITSRYGNWSQTPQIVPGQPGDQSLVPVGSADFDGRRGSEILLQNLTTGQIGVAWPAGGRQWLMSLGDARWSVVDVY